MRAVVLGSGGAFPTQKRMPSSVVLLREGEMFMFDCGEGTQLQLMKSRLGEGESILLDSIARGAGISRPHFFKLFKENVGLTPNIYLNTLRMETAIERLIQSSDAVTSIGLDLGFSSQASFTRFFASNVGIPPSDYRRVAQLSS